MNNYKFELNKCKDKIWYLNDDHHRDLDRPALISYDSYKEWRKHGKWHRDNDKPAVIGTCGTKIWNQHGRFYRDNGKPVVIWPSGRMEYMLNDYL